jgi:hypothetical protein
MRTIAKPAPASPAEPVALSPEAVLARLDQLSQQVHSLTVFVRQNLTTRVDRISEKEAALRLGMCVEWVAKQRKLGRLTDARDPADRGVQGSKILYYSDEINAWAAGGQEECERLRRELGRGRQ